MMPVTPAKINMINAPKANNIGVLSRNFPPQIVATHAKTLIPVGTDTHMVESINSIRIHPGVPLAYIWCTQTNPLTPAMSNEEMATIL